MAILREKDDKKFQAADQARSTRPSGKRSREYEKDLLSRSFKSKVRSPLPLFLSLFRLT